MQEGWANLSISVLLLVNNVLEGPLPADWVS